jgi:hypothetical protein
LRGVLGIGGSDRIVIDDGIKANRPIALVHRRTESPSNIARYNVVFDNAVAIVKPRSDSNDIKTAGEDRNVRIDDIPSYVEDIPQFIRVVIS